jgi:hypothetical protein
MYGHCGSFFSMSKPTSVTQKFVDESTMLQVNHIPAIARMCHRLGLIDLINESIPCNTDLDLGTLVTGMVCDTLSGRSPLYKVEEFIAEQDTELLFGTAVNPRNFNDDALGNALDRIHKTGTLKLFTEVALRAATVFDLDTSQCGFDTTSVNVWGGLRQQSFRKKSPPHHLRIQQGQTPRHQAIHGLDALRGRQHPHLRENEKRELQ